MYGHFGPAGRAYVFAGPGLGQLAAYLSVTALACLGYGSIFLALSLVFKNPILPGDCGASMGDVPCRLAAFTTKAERCLLPETAMSCDSPT